MARAKENQTVHEVVSLVLLGLGTLLFLALISYTPADVPSWFWLSSGAGARGPALNFIGRAGAIVACCSYAFLGAASYLVAALLLGYGGAKLLHPELRLQPRSLWSVVFVLSGACLAHLLPWSLLDLEKLNIAGPGGWVGKWLGEFVFRNVLGIVGSIIFLLLIYCVSLVFMTGVNPLAVVRAIAGAPQQWRAKVHAWKMARADEQQQLQLESERVEKARKKLERSLKKQGAVPPIPETQSESAPAPPADFALAADDEAPRPVPQIIDTNSLPAPKKREKRDKFQPLTEISCENYELPVARSPRSIDTANAETAKPGRTARPPASYHQHARRFWHQRLAATSRAAPPSHATKSILPPASAWTRSQLSRRDLARATLRAEAHQHPRPIPGK